MTPLLSFHLLLTPKGVAFLIIRKRASCFLLVTHQENAVSLILTNPADLPHILWGLGALLKLSSAHKCAAISNKSFLFVFIHNFSINHIIAGFAG